MKHKILLFILSVCLFITAQSQTMPVEPQMADGFRSEGKIYVVIAVIGIIFICLITYLILIDRKLRKIENRK